MSLPPRQQVPPPTTFRAVVRVGELGVAKASVVEYWPTLDALLVFEDYPEPAPSAFPAGPSHHHQHAQDAVAGNNSSKPPAVRLQLYGVDVLNCRAYGPSAAQAERGLADAHAARELATARRGAGGAGLTLGCLTDEPTTPDCVTLTPEGYRDSGTPAAPRLPPAGVLRVTYAPGSATSIALVDTMTIVFPRERPQHFHHRLSGSGSNQSSPQRAMPSALTTPEELAQSTWKAVQSFRRTLMKQAYPHGPQHFVVLMSPVSGRDDGPQQWQSIAVPLLQLTPHTHEVIITEREGHAETIARTRRFEPTDVIVAGGGDGMLHEVLNGLRARHRESESPRPLDHGGGCHRAAGFEGRAFGIATFPVGSGCAASKALGVQDPFCAARALARGSSIAADVLDVVVHELPKGPGSGFVEIGPGLETNSPPLSNASFSAVPSNSSFAVTPSPNKVVVERSAVLGLALGMLASVDLDREKYRWAGKTRFTLDFLKRVATGLPSYRMRVRVRPAKSSMMTVAMQDVTLAAASVNAGAGGGAGSHFDTPTACTERQLGSLAAVQSVCPKATLSAALEVQTHRERADENPQAAALAAASSSWVELHQRDFCLFGLHCTPWLTKDTNIAPYAALNDGTFDLCYSTPALGRANVVSLLSGGESGNHVNADAMRYMKLTGIEIRPMCDGVPATIDGELLSSNPDRIVVTVAPHRIRTVCWAPVTTAPFDAVLALEKQQQAYNARFGSRGGMSSRDGLSMLNESCPSPVAASPVLYEYFAHGA